jgi:hypothetical protein
MRGGAHLSEAGIMDAVDGAAGFEIEDHVERCPDCRRRAGEVRQAWRLAEQADVPEPPALYWEAFRRNVSRRIAAPAPVSRRLPLAAALAAAAVLAGLAVLAPWRGAERARDLPEAGDTLPAWTALPEAGDDTGLQVLEALAVSPDVAIGAECRLAECLVALSDEESRGLAEALRTSLGPAGPERSES